MTAASIKATGIVAEYNPFHNGHLYHLQEAKRLTGQPVIAVISGSIMQRGEPACASKWLRARLAVENGVDLVLELPAAFSLRSAEFFASGAVMLLEACGCVSHLCCGVENPAYDFSSLAKAISDPAAQKLLREKIQHGVSYASACEQILPHASFKTPNDILALEYSKALLAANITPVFVQRRNAHYNDLSITSGIASATAIRRSISLKRQDWFGSVPANTAAALQTITPGYDEKLMWQLICYRLRLLTPQQISRRCQCSEGLENLLKRAANASSLAEALKLCSNKRYSASRIRRLLLQLLLDLPREFIEQNAPAYLRILAFNDTGRQLLKAMKRSAALPIITKLGENPQRGQSTAFVQQLQLEIAATDIWSLLQYDPAISRSGNDFLLPPVYCR